MVVDQPAACEICVDERFSPRAPPALDVRAVTALRQVNPVRDDQGRDVTLEVAARDGSYVDVGRGRWQGVTRDHWVQLPPPVAGDRWLVANGWIHPTDSSINVAIGQQKDVAPRGLELEARTGLGRVWSGLQRFALNTNASFIRSEVQLAPQLSQLARATHPLQGQADSLLNAALS